MNSVVSTVHSIVYGLSLKVDNSRNSLFLEAEVLLPFGLYPEPVKSS
jgi:hypothetical protein